MSGDEYSSRLHDKDNYTIIKNAEGYYVYAVKSESKLAPSGLIVGVDNPKILNIQPGLISLSVYEIQGNRLLKGGQASYTEEYNPSTIGKLNNLVVFIRFADEDEFTENISKYDSLFNNPMSPSVNNYYNEVSYHQLNLKSYFIPSSSKIISYQDSHPRSYYQPYDEKNNPYGYRTSIMEDYKRENELLKNAVKFAAARFSINTNIDNNNDGLVDNISFIVSGGIEAGNTILWPHEYSLYSYDIRIEGLRVNTYTFYMQNFCGVNVLCHELFHSLGAPDLYHYTDNGITPVGAWDIMAGGSGHMSTYMKYKYGKWIQNFTEITLDGEYSLYPANSPRKNVYKINSPYSETEYFVFEYRKKSGNYESSLPGSGLLIYRINKNCSGNSGGPPDEIYLCRPNSTSSINGNINSAYFCQESGRTIFNDSTDPSCCLSNGSKGGISISRVGDVDNIISFHADISSLAKIDSLTIDNMIWLSATLGATVMSDGGHPILERGIVWASSANPTIAVNLGKKSVGGSLGKYSVTAEPLWENGKIHFRGYAITEAGVSYTKDSLFTFNQKNLITNLRYHTAPVISVAYSPDGSIFASLGKDRKIIIYDAKSYSVKQIIKDSSCDLTAIAFSNDGAFLAFGDYESKIRIWDIKSASVIKSYTLFQLRINCLVFSPDGTLLVSGGSTGTIRISDWHLGVINKSLYSIQPEINSICFYPDGQRLVSAGINYSILYSLDNTDKLFPGSSVVYYSAAVSSDGIYAALGSYNTITLFYASNINQVWKKTTDYVRALLFKKDNRTLIAGNNKVISFLDTDGQALSALFGHTRDVNSLCLSCDEDILVSGSDDSTVKVWNIKNLKGSTSVINEIAIPEYFSLHQNYPNPFNPSTTIRYSIPKQARIKISVYSILGQEVEKLVDGIQSAGYHEIIWDAGKYTSGIYLYSLRSGNFVKTKKMVLIR